MSGPGSGGRRGYDAELTSLVSEGNEKSTNSGTAGAGSEGTIQITKRKLHNVAIGVVALMVASFFLGRESSSVESKAAIDIRQKMKGVGFRPFPKGSGAGVRKSKLTKEQINAVRRESLELIRLLDDYYSVYEGGATSMLAGVGGWSQPWDFNNKTNARENKMIDTMARALLDESQDKFIIGVIGSSVAAGHDNCRYDNYESQLERTFGRVWEAAGMKLEVQNAGQGGGCGDSYKNQVWCVKQNVSPFADIVHYSWTYFEVDMSGYVQREMLVRWTQMLPRQPPVHVVDVGHHKSQCYRNNPKNGRLIDTYKPYGYNVFCMRVSMFSGLHNKTGIIFEGGHVGDGIHNTTRYGELEPDKDRQDSLGVILRNWHPGPLGFQTVSDAYAYVYAQAILHALDRIEAEMKERSVHTESRPIVLAKDLPEPLFCEPQYCKRDETPECLNFELPTFGWHGASIARPDDDLNPYRVQLQNWTMEVDNHDLASFMIPKFEQSYFKDDPGFCQFPDKCAGVTADSHTQGRVVFKLPKMNVGMIAICGCCGKEAASPMILMNEFLEIEFNGRKLDRSTWHTFQDEGKCVQILSEHGTSVGDSGHSYLSLRVLEGNVQQIKISHVITI